MDDNSQPKLITAAKELIADGRLATALRFLRTTRIMREMPTYRREARSAQADGVKPPEQHHQAHEELHGLQRLLAAGDTC